MQVRPQSADDLGSNLERRVGEGGTLQNEHTLNPKTAMASDGFSLIWTMGINWLHAEYSKVKPPQAAFR